jgi:hypothetical protein
VDNYLFDLSAIPEEDFDKWCPRCKQMKKSSEFFKANNTGDGLAGYCKDCTAEYTKDRLKPGDHYQKYGRKWYQENKDYELSRALVKSYGITLDDKRQMLIQQGGKCAICGNKLSAYGRGSAVDHCHDTGNIRGVLCANCNKGLGCFKDDVSRLANAIQYLEATNDRQ